MPVQRMGVETGPDEGFDALEGRYGNMIEMGIIDPLRLPRSALRNGASVAGLPLTTNSLVAEEQTPWGGRARDVLPHYCSRYTVWRPAVTWRP
jgi:chaperonin GroEL